MGETDSLMPRPEQWNTYVINSYVRPKGLHATKKTPKMSESEVVFQDRYSKRNIGLVSLEKSGMTICSQIRKGFSGQHKKPISKMNSKSNSRVNMSSMRRQVDTSGQTSQYSMQTLLPHL